MNAHSLSHTHTDTHAPQPDFSLNCQKSFWDKMSAAVCAFFLMISTLCGSRGVSGVLSGPTNVRLTSYNMNLVLRWDPPEGAASGLVYTTEYSTVFVKHTAGCVNTSSLHCDFTCLNVSIIEYGKYTGRVRAQRGAESSVWVESEQIRLDEHTLIGAPNVSLHANGATIDVSIKDPVFIISALRRAYIFATYNITYWKDGHKETAKSISNLQQNRVVLDDLDFRTTYCVQVQINTDTNSRPSELSVPVCERTADGEEAPWVGAVVTFVVMAAAVALVVVSVKYRRNISHFLCPKDALPQHFKDYPPSNSPVYVAMQKSHPPQEIYHPVSIVADDRTVE